MLAARIHEDGGPEVLRVEEVPDPVPGPGEVLVRLHAASLNHLDIWVRKGLPSVPKPRILGADGAGVVEALGDGVGGLEVGQRVVLNPGMEHGDTITVVGEHCDGTHAELIAIDAAQVFPLDEDLSFEVAAAFPLVYETAYRMLVTRAGGPGRRMGAHLGDRRRRRDRGVRDLPRARRAHDRHVGQRREARGGARMGRRCGRQPRTTATSSPP